MDGMIVEVLEGVTEGRSDGDRLVAMDGRNVGRMVGTADRDGVDEGDLDDVVGTCVGNKVGSLLGTNDGNVDVDF